MATNDSTDDRPGGGTEQQPTEDTDTTMSEANNTTEDEQNEYQVAVWAKRELTPRVAADNPDEAEEEARDHVGREHGISSRDILSVNHEADLGVDGHRVCVWVKQEFVETVTARSEEQAEDEAADYVCMEYSISTRDVKSTNVEAVR